jgi:hypothetical protein
MKKKRGQPGSLEKLGAPEGDEVVGQNDEGHFANFFRASSRPDVVAQSALEHREEGLHLGSLPIVLA